MEQRRLIKLIPRWLNNFSPRFFSYFLMKRSFLFFHYDLVRWLTRFFEPSPLQPWWWLGSARLIKQCDKSAVIEGDKRSLTLLNIIWTRGIWFTCWSMGYKYRQARKVTSLLFNAFTQAVNNNEISHKLDPLFHSSYLLGSPSATLVSSPLWNFKDST